MKNMKTIGLMGNEYRKFITNGRLVYFDRIKKEMYILWNYENTRIYTFDSIINDDVDNISITSKNEMYVKYKNGDLYRYIINYTMDIVTQNKFICNLNGSSIMYKNIIVTKDNVFRIHTDGVYPIADFKINTVNNYKLLQPSFSPLLYKLVDDKTKKIINTIMICNYYAPTKIKPKYLLYEIITFCL